MQNLRIFPIITKPITLTSPPGEPELLGFKSVLLVIKLIAPALPPLPIFFTHFPAASPGTASEGVK